MTWTSAEDKHYKTDEFDEASDLNAKTFRKY